MHLTVKNSLFFCYSLLKKDLFFIFRPHYSLVFFADYFLINIKSGQYSLINKPHPDIPKFMMLKYPLGMYAFKRR